jgi:putative membrane protein insertion efficiency factor
VSPLAYLFKGMILLYRYTLSSVMGMHCRYQPTCSVYALEAITAHGAIKGMWLAVRRIGLQAFGTRAIRRDEPLASLEAVLVPLFLHHRYQLEGAVRSVGGVDYTYAVRGDGQTPVRVVPADRQREALDVVLETLDPEFLAIPRPLLDSIPPRPFGASGGEEFAKRTGLTLDPLGAALEPGPELYEALLRKLAADLKACLENP